MHFISKLSSLLASSSQKSVSSGMLKRDLFVRAVLFYPTVDPEGRRLSMHREPHSFQRESFACTPRRAVAEV